MFGILKRKLKEAVKKLTKKVEEEEREEIEEVEKREVIEKKISEEERKPEEEKKGRRKREKERPKPEKEKKESIVRKIKKKISKEVEISEEDIKDILWDIQLSLLEADVALEATEKICEDVKSSLIGKKIKKGEIEKIVKKSFEDALLKILSVPSLDVLREIEKKKPYVIVFLGFNGSGKTTTIAKIAKLLKDRNKKVVLAAADTFRAASIEQLEEHASRIGVKVIKHRYGADPAAVVFDAIKHAKTKGIDVVLSDTAGRAHTNAGLMEELKKICRVNKPDLKILVVDALTGNDVIEQCKTFDESLDIDGIIFTKADVCEKGGGIISAVHTIKKPVLFLGIGQGYADLERFDAKKFVKNLLE